MTANAEARSLLDNLMGADRNALLPAGKNLLCICLYVFQVFVYRLGSL